MALSEEQFRKLLEHQQQQQTELLRSFCQGRERTPCTATYNGKKDAKSVEAFICGLNLYRKKQRVPDAEILEELPLILTAEAAEWWHGVKNDISTYEDFIAILRKTFAPQKPAYLLYNELNTVRQGHEETTEDFINRKRQLFSLLPEPKHVESQQIDMVFALIRLEIRDKIQRNSIKTFDELLDTARSVEEILREKHGGPVIKSTTSRPKCNFCKNPGHTADVCRKKMAAERKLSQPPSTTMSQITQAPSPSQPKFSCYGCGTPGVVRSNCRTCAGKMTAPIKKEDLAFCSLNMRIGPKPRPMVYLTVNGIHGSAYIDTCAKTSVASYHLYCQLLKQGCVFNEKVVQLTLADGIPKEQRVLTVEANVYLCGKIIPTSFIVLPEAKNNKTLLGVGFIQEARMVLNVPQYTFHFLGEDNQVFELYTENFVMFNEGPDTPEPDVFEGAAAPVSSRPGGMPQCSDVYAMEPTERATTGDAFCPKRIKPNTPKKNTTLFDGFSPRMDYMYRDAQINVHRLSMDLELSPHSKSLFPDNEDVGLSALDVDLCIGKELDDHQRQLLMNVIQSHEKIFTPNGKPAKHVTHKIDTAGKGPVSVPPYRLSPPRKEVLRAEIDRMIGEEPLTRLTKKGAPWIWHKEQDDAYEELKRRLATAPILRQADETKPYTIKTDASAYALGAVLVQGEGDDEHPVEYASRLLTPAERNYSTTEREALAVVWAVNKFRGYIEGLPTVILTDHQALRWLLSLKSPTGKLARWALQLQAFDLTIKYVPGKTNVVADFLSRLPCTDENRNECAICTVTIDMPVRSPKDIREDQLKDSNVLRIVKALEQAEPNENAIYWSNKGYFLNNGLLYRLAPDSDCEDAQLVVPEHEWGNILAAYHDDPLAGHNGVEKTLARISKRYFWKGMRSYTEAYIKNCIACQRYKPSNMKPAGLLQTSSLNKRFEAIAFDLFGPLPSSPDGKTWILTVEDYASRWIELFALDNATAETCADVLIKEVFLRYGIPRRMTSDNGPQFVSAVMQSVAYSFNIKHSFTPIYHPEANPVERRNRDLKTQLAILVGDDHTGWPDKLPSIRFALNTAVNSSTSFSPAYMTFGRELRTPDDNLKDFRQIVLGENFIPEITPKLLRIADVLSKAREVQEMSEEKRKEYVDRQRREGPVYQPGDLVLADVHPLSKASKGHSAKLAPRRDGPYMVLDRHGPSSYKIANRDAPEIVVGVYHSSALRPFHTTEDSAVPVPLQPLRRRGRPRIQANPTDNTNRRGRGRGRGRRARNHP